MGITININADEVHVHTTECPEAKDGIFVKAERVDGSTEGTAEDYLGDLFDFDSCSGSDEVKPGELTADEEMFLEGRAESELSVGDIVKLNFFGKPTEFRVVHKNYKTEGKVVLMPENIDLFHIFNKEYDNEYASSGIREFLNNVYLRGLHPLIQSIIAHTPVECADSGNAGNSIINDKAWLPSYTEMGFSGSSYAPTEGSPFAYFNSDKKRKKVGSCSEKWYWLRTPYSGDSSTAWNVNADGTANDSDVTYSYGVVPAFEI